MKIRTDNTPGGPVNVMVPAAAATYSGISIIWDKPADLQAAAECEPREVTGYRVYVNGEPRAVTAANETYYTADGLEPDAGYTFAVSSLYGPDESEPVEIKARTEKKGAVHNVMQPPYNAKGDGITLDTAAIQAAVDACADYDVVLIPGGYTFLTGALDLKSNMTLEVNGTLLSSKDASDFERRPAAGGKCTGGTATGLVYTEEAPKRLIWSRIEGWEQYSYRSLINIGFLDENTDYGKDENYVCANVKIIGKGIITGDAHWAEYEPIKGGACALAIAQGESADIFYDISASETAENAIRSRIRGRLINISNARNVYIQGVTVAKPPMWTIHMIYSDNITTNGVTFRTSEYRNGDGWDPDSSTNCTIYNCSFDTGDDCIAVKSGKNPEGNAVARPSRNIRIIGCTSEGGLGLAVGSEMSGGVSGVYVRDCVFSNTRYGIELKANRARGGYIRDVHVRDCTVDRVLIHSVSYNADGAAADTSPVFRDMSFKNMNILGYSSQYDNPWICTSVELEGFAQESGGDAYYVQNILFENITAGTRKNTAQHISMKYCRGITFKRVRQCDGAAPVYLDSDASFLVDGQVALIKQILHPEAAFSPIPFWFFNDAFDGKKVQSQLEDYVEKGVHGFVLHPRIGIPEDMPYLSEAYFTAVRFIVKTAAVLGMKVVLYDEGMYPSGSAHGKVVEENPEYASKGLFLTDGDTGHLPEGAEPVYRLADGRALYYGFTGGTIRGIHFGEDDGEAGAPRAADILNPDAVDAFIRLTHDAYYEHLKEYFGNTVIGFFTDEPCALGRGGAGFREWAPGLERELVAAGGSLEELAALFPEKGAQPCENPTVVLYRRLIKKKLRETFYGKLSGWCAGHQIALMGHPAESDDIEEEMYFDIPGQDLIMRRVSPETGGLLEPDSVQAKLTADLARLLGRRRNANECFGVCCRSQLPWYMTAGDMKWYIDWLGLRGVNLFIPHAFYYSVAGKRKEERPPDAGPNNIWWRHYRLFSDYMKRLSFLMTDSANGARLAVLCDDNRVPYRETAYLYENQIEFCYVPAALLEKAAVADGSVVVNGQRFCAALNFLGKPYEERFSGKLGALLLTGTEASDVKELAADGLELSEPCPGLRKVRLCKDGVRMLLFGNEGKETICATVRAAGWQQPLFIDLWKGTAYRTAGAGEVFPLYLEPYETVLVTDTGTANPEMMAEAFGAAVEQRPADWFRKECPDWTEKFIPVSMQKNEKTYRLTKFFQKVAGDERFEVDGAEMVECYCNGYFAGVSFWGKHRFEIGRFLAAGENEIRLAVTGNAANLYGTHPVDFGLGVHAE